MKLVLFNVSSRNYGADITQVREIIRVNDSVPIPDMPPWVEGIINIRGKVIPVIHLAKKIGLEASTAEGLMNRVIIAHAPGRAFGVAVDSVTSVITLPEKYLSAPDDILKEAGYIAGVAKIGDQLVPIMDLFAMLTDSDAACITNTHNGITNNIPMN